MSPDEAKRRLRDFAERHDAGKRPWPQIAAAGAGVAVGLLAIRLLKRRGRHISAARGAGSSKVAILSRLAAPLVPLAVAYIRNRLAARGRSEPRWNGHVRGRGAPRWVTPPSAAHQDHDG